MPYAKSDNIDIYYEVHGTTGPNLVFAHGAGGNATSWWQQVPAFADTHRIAVFDHRGFARSVCAPEEQSAARFEDDLVAVMDAAGMDRAVIVCQSMGGWTGVRAAVNRTERVRGVLLANTPGAVRNETTIANMAQMAERLAAAGGLVNHRLPVDGGLDGCASRGEPHGTGPWRVARQHPGRGAQRDDDRQHGANGRALGRRRRFGQPGLQPRIRRTQSGRCCSIGRSRRTTPRRVRTFATPPCMSQRTPSRLAVCRSWFCRATWIRFSHRQFSSPWRRTSTHR